MESYNSCEMKACMIKYKEEDRNWKAIQPYKDLIERLLITSWKITYMKLELLAIKKRKTDIKFEASNLKIINRILDMSSLL